MVDNNDGDDGALDQISVFCVRSNLLPWGLGHCRFLNDRQIALGARFYFSLARALQTKRRYAPHCLDELDNFYQLSCAKVENNRSEYIHVRDGLSLPQAESLLWPPRNNDQNNEAGTCACFFPNGRSRKRLAGQHRKCT